MCVVVISHTRGKPISSSPSYDGELIKSQSNKLYNISSQNKLCPTSNGNIF